ncbi:MAG: hypothetical protein ABSE08_06880 [Syntrophobacteraceae bacterium]
MKITDSWFFIAAFAAIIVIVAYPHGAWASCRGSAGTARLFMPVPEDFERFIYESSLNGKVTRHMFGEQAMDELRMQLSPFFGSIMVEHVENEAAARQMLHSGDYDMPNYDLIAIPKFRNVNFWVQGWHYGFDIDLVVEVYPYDMSKVTQIRGHGESRTGFNADSSPGESAGIAMRMAVEAVADGVCQAGNSLY